MKESEVQKKIISELKKDNWLVEKMELGRNGYPDLIAIKDGKVIFIEVKQKGKKPRKLQEYRINQLRKKGVVAFYADSLEMFREKFAKFSE